MACGGRLDCGCLLPCGHYEKVINTFLEAAAYCPADLSALPHRHDRTPPALDHDALDELDTLLDDLRTRDEDVPQWEFCDGFLTALV